MHETRWYLVVKRSFFAFKLNKCFNHVIIINLDIDSYREYLSCCNHLNVVLEFFAIGWMLCTLNQNQTLCKFIPYKLFASFYSVCSVFFFLTIFFFHIHFFKYNMSSTFFFSFLLGLIRFRLVFSFIICSCDVFFFFFYFQ